MGVVVVQATMSLDGFIADPDDRVGPLFDWYSNGDVAVTLGDEERVFHTTEASAEYVRWSATEIGACVIGRRLFDLTNGWNGRPAAGDAVFVVTHEAPTAWPFPDAPFTFVTDGLASAVAQAQVVAGPERSVSITAGELGRQALEAGLADELRVDLVPVVFGRGVSFFGGFTGRVMLGNPRVIEGDRVVHLLYPVQRS